MIVKITPFKAQAKVGHAVTTLWSSPEKADWYRTAECLLV